MDRQIDRQTDRWIDRWIKVGELRLIDIDRYMYVYICIYMYIYIFRLSSPSLCHFVAQGLLYLDVALRVGFALLVCSSREAYYYY